MNKINKKIAITTGDVNGIGAEITIKALNFLNLPKENVIIISNKKVLNFYGKLKNDYPICEIDFDEKNILPGEITSKGGEFSFKALKKACEIVQNREADAIVTAPVAKEALHMAGYKFSGQTEVLQKYLAKENQHAEMLFVAEDFRVLLLTRHVALKEVNFSKDELIQKISDLNEFFKEKLNIFYPKFALCALNPHAGENGILGREEIEIMNPAVEILKSKNINITEPLPADTLFIKASKSYLNNTPSPYDCYIAAYHDQGLIPIKAAAFEKTVNMTIGLDVIRTSPCHGTAFDIAGKNKASAESMIEAIKLSLI
jgi:4-hydroxythreonine-4-phosphate dehydrogenase